MGPGGFSIWQLLIILVIVALLFGTKRLSSIGSDVGSAIKGFKKSINDDEDEKDDKDQEQDARQVEADEKDAEKSAQSAKKSKADSKS